MATVVLILDACNAVLAADNVYGYPGQDWPD